MFLPGIKHNVTNRTARQICCPIRSFTVTYPFSFIIVCLLLRCFYKWRLSNLTEDSWISHRTVAGDCPSILLHTMSSMQTGGAVTRTRTILAIFPRETRWTQASGPWHLVLCGTTYSVCYLYVTERAIIKSGGKGHCREKGGICHGSAAGNEIFAPLRINTAHIQRQNHFKKRFLFPEEAWNALGINTVTMIPTDSLSKLCFSSCVRILRNRYWNDRNDVTAVNVGEWEEEDEADQCCDWYVETTGKLDRERRAAQAGLLPHNVRRSDTNPDSCCSLEIALRAVTGYPLVAWVGIA